MQLEPIHISFTGGSRGEYLSSVVYTAYFKKLPIYEINDAGKMRISNEPNISKLHKTFPRIDKITEEKFLKVMSAQKITPLIGISHYVDELQNLFDKNFDKNCYVVKLLQKSPVIIIEYDEDDIPSIAIQSSIKNGEKTYEKKLKGVNLRWLENCKSFFTNFAYVHYKDLTSNLPKVFKTISMHTGLELQYNDYTDQIVNQYLEKNKNY